MGSVREVLARDDDGLALGRDLLRTPGRPAPRSTLTVRRHPLPSRWQAAAARQRAEELTATKTLCPGTVRD